MMITRNSKRVPNSSLSTPYVDLLRGLSGVGDHDAETLGLLGAMIECVEEDRYGTLRLLYRCLPFRDRQALGPPPESRAEDVYCGAGTEGGLPVAAPQDTGSPVVHG